MTKFIKLSDSSAIPGFEKNTLKLKDLDILLDTFELEASIVSIENQLNTLALSRNVQPIRQRRLQKDPLYHSDFKTPLSRDSLDNFIVTMSSQLIDSPPGDYFAVMAIDGNEMFACPENRGIMYINLCIFNFKVSENSWAPSIWSAKSVQCDIINTYFRMDLFFVKRVNLYC